MNFQVRRAAVLGAGVMGAQIAAHLANADVPVLLFDLPAKEGDANAIVVRALDGLKELEPAPLATKDRIKYLDVANYDQHLDLLRDCDFIIEAIAEKMGWKEDLYRKISRHIAPSAIFASNTSGLPINRLAAALPQSMRSRFCGVHFFNPPRYMHLVELIPASTTSPDVVDNLETWIVSRLGKGVVRAKDTPNFLANRVGVMWLLTVAHHTERLGLAFDEVDALTGPQIGLPKSATYRLLDVIGLDTMGHVINTMRDRLADDPWHAYYMIPGWLSGLVEKGALGQKTKEGIYRREGKEIRVFDRGLGDYRATGREVAPEVKDILRIREPGARLEALRASSHPQAQLLWLSLRDLFHYCAVHLVDIACNARDLDFALRWGYGWRQGPFELWQAAGWNEITAMIREDIEAGRTMAAAPLPDWVFAQNGVHASTGSYSPADNALSPRSGLPVYRRQLFPERLLGEASDEGETIWENKGLRLWRLPSIDAGIVIASFRTRMHALNSDVLDGMLEAIGRAEREYAGLVLWHEAPFAVGADLKEMVQLIGAKQFDRLDRFVVDFQRMTRAVRYCQVPAVAAVQGMALAGGCELLMHCAHRVAALESNVGLVEAGVGLVPAAGGCNEFTLRAARVAAQQHGGEPNPFVYAAFQTLFNGKTSKSALEAREMGFLTETDTILLNPYEILFVAIRMARTLSDAGYRPPLVPRAVPVPGRPGIASLENQLANMREANFISAHDYRVGKAIATAMCGGDVEGRTLVDEQWLFDVERQQFMELARTPETLARIVHMLEAGKPLRN